MHAHHGDIRSRPKMLSAAEPGDYLVLKKVKWGHNPESNYYCRTPILTAIKPIEFYSKFYFFKNVNVANGVSLLVNSFINFISL